MGRILQGIIMKGIFMTVYQSSAALLRCLPLVAVLLVGACLPDSDKERDSLSFREGQATSYATTLLSYASSSQSSLLNSSAFQDGTLAQGMIGTSSDSRMSYGYCRQGSDPVNHMMITWFRSDASDGSFSLKSLGEGAGSPIVQALSKVSVPSSVGYYKNGTIHLLGPRTGGQNTLAVPAACNLNIDNDAPVILVENMLAPESGVTTGGSYVYKTQNCPDNQVGLVTFRCLKTSDGSCAPESSSGWSEHDNTCNGAVSVRSVSVAPVDTTNIVGAFDVNAGSLRGALQQGLQNLDCREVKTSVTLKDKDGKDVTEEKVMANSCDADKLDPKDYVGPEETEITDKVLMRKTKDAQCDGAAGTKSASYNFQGKLYTGTMTFGNWTGPVKYYRETLYAYADNNDADKVHKDTTYLDKWKGESIVCKRPETLVIKCNDMFPQYKDGKRYEPVNTGGVTFKRTNKIDGWKDPVGLIPNDPLHRDAEWKMTGVQCSWDELRSFTGCPGGFSLTSPGLNKRLHTISLGTFPSATIGAWRKITPLVCTRIIVTEKAC